MNNAIAQVTELIYVHSKLMIVDDKITIVGSGIAMHTEYIVHR